MRSYQPQTIEEAKRRIVENFLYVGTNPSLAALEMQRSRSMRRWLINDVTQAAAKYAQSIGANVRHFEVLANQGADVLEALICSVVKWKHGGGDYSDKEYWNFWEHRRNTENDHGRHVPLFEPRSTHANCCTIP